MNINFIMLRGRETIAEHSEVRYRLRRAGESTESKIIDGVVQPAGKLVDPISGLAKFKKILLDCTYINDNELLNLRNWLKNQSNLTIDQINRIVEINVNL